MTRGEADDAGPALDRRALLGGLAGLGAASLAGCVGSGGDGGDPDTLTTYMPKVPQQYNWHTSGVPSYWPRLVWPFCFDRLAARRPDGSVEALAAADWRHDASTIEVEVSPSAGWSDGSPVQGGDWGMAVAARRFRLDRSPAEVTDAGDPGSVLEATTSVTWDGRTATLHSDPGFYDRFDVDGWLETELTQNGALFRHREGLSADLERLREIEDPYSEAGARAVADVLGPRNPEERSDPTAARTSGAFAVAEERPGDVILEPNPHFRAADGLEVPRIRVTTSSSVRARYGQFMNGAIDVLPGTGAVPPEPVVDDFPERTGTYRWDRDSWQGLLVNGAGRSYLAPPAARQALLYALDSAGISEAAHRDATDPLSAPPGLQHSSVARDVPSELAASFRSYEHDPARAIELFREAGFTGDADALYTPSGERFSLEIVTSDDEITSEVALESQLGNVGVDVTVLHLTDTLGADRLHKGNFELATRPWSATPGTLFVEAMRNEVERTLFGVWTQDRIEEWVASTEGVRTIDYPWTTRIEGFTPEDTRPLTVTAPPVGEPDSDERVDYPVVYMGLMLERALEPETRSRYTRELAWAFNWTLPILPLITTYKLTFLRGAEWTAPSDPEAWNRDDPFFYHVSEGNVAPRQ